MEKEEFKNANGKFDTKIAELKIVVEPHTLENAELNTANLGEIRILLFHILLFLKSMSKSKVPGKS